MARTEAIKIFLENGVDEAQLAEIYGGVIENFEADAVSIALKAKNAENVSAGSAEFKRFENAVTKAYGTARTAGAGAYLETKPVVVPIATHREIVEEFRKADVQAYGIPSLLALRAENHPRQMVRELDTEFFKKAYSTGTQFVPVGATIQLKVEELIVKLETISNSFIDGVDREDIAVVLTPANASALRTAIDTMLVQGNEIGNGLLGKFHGVDIYVSNRLPKGALQVVDMVGMVKGAIAQPVLLADQYAVEKIPLSNDFATELFFDYGTAPLMADTIFYVGDLYVA